jgi:hypothetical protein
VPIARPLILAERRAWRTQSALSTRPRLANNCGRIVSAGRPASRASVYLARQADRRLRFQVRSAPVRLASPHTHAYESGRIKTHTPTGHTNEHK